MRATIDRAGRVVIPQPLRESAGLAPGEVEVVADGAGVRIEPVAVEGLEEQDGRLVIPRSEVPIGADTVRSLRDAGQK